MRATKAKVAAAVIAAATLSGGAAVWATTSTSPSTSTIWACKINATGLVRVVDGPSQCSSRYETALSWNVVGPKGATGATGPAGAKGATGATGLPGAKGATGATGPQGAKGAAGPVGPQGPKGDKGAKGDTGASGVPGPAGAKGDTGATGSAGPAGAKGDTGATGSAGPAGPKGDTGATGAAGSPGGAGATGPQGPPGPAGTGGAATYAWWNSNATLLEGSSPSVNGVVFARDPSTDFAVPGVFCFDLETPATAVVANLTVGFADSYLMSGGAFSSLGTITLHNNQQVTCPDGYQDAIVADSRNENGFPTTFSAVFF